ncbi:hypothetical protein [Tenacibaculum halocynthiae]|uniref:hypothetical protein n=1 Tax=Tenacibaculum halocynthiae TaxID=1254437 RepID=UPI0038935366
MKKSLLITFILLFTNSLFSQTAEFIADTVSLKKRTGNNERVYEKALEMEWIINGEKLFFGSKPIKVIPNEKKIDTILFRNSSNSKYDIIICNIAEASKFSFEYNPCCGGFNVRKENKGKLSRDIIFEISEKNENDMYLGTLGQTGILLEKDNIENHINEICRSAMSPNIYSIAISKIRKNCDSLKNCEELLCEIQDGVAKDGFEYEVIETKMEFLYMPLDEKILKVLFNKKTNRTELKYVW